MLSFSTFGFKTLSWGRTLRKKKTSSGVHTLDDMVEKIQEKKKKKKRGVVMMEFSRVSLSS